jgi:hypothetical protein
MKIFAYKMTHDTGVAPCVDNNAWSLAVCRGDIRRSSSLERSICDKLLLIIRPLDVPNPARTKWTRDGAEEFFSVSNGSPFWCTKFKLIRPNRSLAYRFRRLAALFRPISDAASEVRLRLRFARRALARSAPLSASSTESTSIGFPQCGQPKLRG